MKCIQHTMKENLLLLKDLLKLKKKRIFKHMTAISKNVYFDLLDDINTIITLFIELLKLNLMKLQMIIMLSIMKFQIKNILNLKLVTML